MISDVNEKHLGVIRIDFLKKYSFMFVYYFGNFGFIFS